MYFFFKMLHDSRKKVKIFYKINFLGVNMAIIVLARELAALGDETAKELCSMLPGYHYINKEEIEETLHERGITEKMIGRYGEKKPGFFDVFSSAQNQFLHHLKTVLYEKTESGNCILVGQGAPVLLKGVPGVVTFRLICPENIRIQRIMKRFNCDERRAQLMMTHTDNDRVGFNRYFFDVGWRDPINYDFIINTERLNAAQTAGIIKNILPQLVDEKQENECKTAISNLITGQKILTKVLYEEKLPIYFLEALYDGKSVTLNGVTNAPSSIEKVSNIAKEITGCDEVHSNIYIASDIPMTHEV